MNQQQNVAYVPIGVIQHNPDGPTMKRIRRMGRSQISSGVVCLIFGTICFILDPNYWYSVAAVGIWCGIVSIFAGSFSVINANSGDKRVMGIVFNIFCIISSGAASGMSFTCFFIVINCSTYCNYDYYYDYDCSSNCPKSDFWFKFVSSFIAVLMLINVILTFILCFLIGGCCGGNNYSQGTVIVQPNYQQPIIATSTIATSTTTAHVGYGAVGQQHPYGNLPPYSAPPYQHPPPISQPPSSGAYYGGASAFGQAAAPPYQSTMASAETYVTKSTDAMKNRTFDNKDDINKPPPYNPQHM